MIWKSKVRYWTLFCPKYCATSGAVPASTSTATAPAIRRLGIILSTRPAGTTARLAGRPAPPRVPPPPRLLLVIASRASVCSVRASGAGRKLLLHDAHPDLGPDVGVDLDADLEVTQLADRLGEVHLAFVHVDAELLELALDVARRDRSVQLVFLAHLDIEGELDIGEPPGLGLSGGLLGGRLSGDALRLVGQLPLIRLGGGLPEPLP